MANYIEQIQELKQLIARAKREIESLKRKAKVEKIAPKKKYKRVPGDADVKLEPTKPKRIRTPKSKLKQRELSKELKKAYREYEKQLRKEQTAFYRQTFKATLKSMRVATAYNKLQASYNRAVMKATELGINKGFEKITIQSLMKQGFKPTPTKIKELMMYMSDVIAKMTGDLHDPNLMLGTLEYCVSKSAGAGFIHVSNRIYAIVTKNNILELLSTPVPLYSENFSNWIEELYSVCNVDEDRSNQLLTLIEDQISKIESGE